jgi:uncharacterized protein (DUF1810 family)
VAASDLTRFVEVHDDHERALAEIRDGRKRTHWMWYLFPQVAGLGESSESRRYAIASLDEARDFLTHPLLGPDYVRIVDEVWHQVVERDRPLRGQRGVPPRWLRAASTGGRARNSGLSCGVSTGKMCE